jgi:hypothetical protein
MNASRRPTAYLLACAIAGLTATAPVQARQEPARAGFPAAPQAAQRDEDAFRAIRAAEIGGDAERLREWSGDGVSTRVRARAALAAEAIRLRSGARTVGEAVDAEDAVERRRTALLEKIASDTPAAARELVLESAEDLLLRRHVLSFGDALVAVGLPTGAELRQMRALLSAVDARLGSPLVASCLAPDAAVATDAAAFRAHALKGLSMLLAADLFACEADGLLAESASTDARHAARARAERARAEAQRLLARASLCELPIPPALSDILSLARGRVEPDPAERTRLLARAAESADPAIALVARIARWKDQDSRGAFPKPRGERAPVDALARVGDAAEVRARLAAGGGVGAVAAAIADSLQRAGADSRDPAVSIARRRAVAEWFAERLPADTLRAAAESGAPFPLVAVAALAPGGDRVLDVVLDGVSDRVSDRVSDAGVAAITRDPLVGPIVAIRVAERLATRGAPDAAAETLLEAVRAFDGLPAARQAIDLALDLRRSLGEPPRLDAALALAIARFPGEAATNGWTFERIDLALHDAGRVRDLGRAAALLEAMAANRLHEADRAARSLRSIELELARLNRELELDETTTSTRQREAREEAREEARATRLDELGTLATALDIAALPAAPTDASPAHVRTLAARLATARAEIELASGDMAKARVLADRALADRLVDDGTALRAAKVWIGSALAPGDGGHAPRALLEFAARSPTLRAWIAAPLSRHVDRAEAAIVDGSVAADAAGAIEFLATLATAPDGASDVSILRARAMARFAALDRGGAEELAREAVAADPDDRLAQWLLAEALRRRDDSPGRVEAFSLYRSASPLSAPDRDRFWWRSQLAQLEMLAEQPGRSEDRADIVARVNRLAAIDGSLGGPALAKRFEAVRARALAATAPARPADAAGEGAGEGVTR